MKTKYFSEKINRLPKGCKMCVKGRKLVLFVTGKCSRKCFYCSISDNKYQNNTIYANERKVNSFNDIINEAKISSSKGAGLTGGDPLADLPRTIKLIKLLKKEFGKSFHIHLYTIPESITKENLIKLEKVGLDEIRLHPNLENEKFWKNLKFLKEIKIDKGIEIPVIPHLYKNTIKLLKYSLPFVKFINLNELEFADNDINSIRQKGYETVNDSSYAVKSSYLYGQKILKHFKKSGKNLHLCSSKLKDNIQLKNRIKLRAKNIKLPWEKITSEGTIIRNAIYTKNSLPPKKGNLNDIKLLKKLKVKEKHKLDNKNYRILIKKKIKLPKDYFFCKIEEYPTDDNFIIELEIK